MITSNRNIVNINPITFRGVIGDRSNPNAIIPSNLFEQRDVQRAGWLRYIPFAEKYSQSNEYRFWVVFAVYGSKTPYLEFYKQRHRNLNQIDSNQTLSDGPVSKHSLFNCRHIASVIESNQQRHNEFSITLETHVIRLAADSHEVMLDWINSLKTKLISMKILQPSENLYSDCPPASSSTTSNPTIYRQSTGINSINQFEPRILRPTSTANNATSEELYEPIFEISNAVQSLSLNRAQSIPQDEGPPPYECIFNGSNNLEEIARFSFRESQVDKFKKEMEQINGISLKIRKKDCHNAIAFVDVHTFGIFVAGWKQKDHPYLHNSLHIGDQLVSINGMKIESASQIKRFVKQCSSNLDIIIRRVPYGQIFCLKRSFDGQDLGLIREKGTARINEIVSGSCADQAGVPSRCTFHNVIDDDNTQRINNQNYWFLTEINNRPLNLFFKNNEIGDRLNAIGKEISILVQPYGFIKHLKNGLKSYKNYKDYLVQ